MNQDRYMVVFSELAEIYKALLMRAPGSWLHSGPIYEGAKEILQEDNSGLDWWLKAIQYHLPVMTQERAAKSQKKIANILKRKSGNLLAMEGTTRDMLSRWINLGLTKIDYHSLAKKEGEWK